jgi:hypothetical protein
VIWESYTSPGSDPSYSIQGQRFSSSGGALGSQFQVNSYTTGIQLEPAVAAAGDGDFVVVWEGPSATDANLDGIRGQRYASSGTALGGEFQVNTYTTGAQAAPQVAADPDGNFVVAWHGASASDATGIVARRYASGGTALGGEFQVNTYTTGDQRSAALDVDAAGDFAVVWQSLGSPGNDSSSASVQGRRFSSDGAAVGGQFQVNAYTTTAQLAPVAAVADDGHFVVVWESYGSVGNDTQSSSIQGQRFLAPEPSGGLLVALALAGVGGLARDRNRRLGPLGRRSA